MTRDEIIKLAREAGFNWPDIQTTTIEERLERFAALVAAAEREECAKVCYEESTRRCSTLAARSMLMEAAVAIRARSGA